MGTVVYLRPHGISRDYDEPIANMNMTPLIDVLLVLLVMLIITVPMALHKVDVDLPVAGPPVDRLPVTQKLVLATDGSISWNGVAIDEATLTKQLQTAVAAKDELEFQTDANARYDRFAQLVTVVKKSGIKQIAFTGNRAFAHFGK